MMGPSDVPVLIPGICKYLTWQNDSVDVMKVRTLRWGDYLGSSTWALNIIINVLSRQSRGRFDIRKEKHYDGKVGEESAMCCKEDVTIQRMQVASEPGESKIDPPREPPEGASPANTLVCCPMRLISTTRMVGESIYTVRSHQVLVICYIGPRKLTQVGFK